MGHAFGLLLAFTLPSSLIIYWIGTLFLKQLQLTGATKGVGFFVAWLITAIGALIMAEQPTVASAQQGVIPATFIGAIIALVGIAVARKRKVS